MDGHENTPIGGVGFDGNAVPSGSNPPQMNNIPNNNGGFSAPQNPIPQAAAPNPQPARKYIPNHEQRTSGRVFTEQPIVSPPAINFGENAGDVVIQNKPAKKPHSFKKIAIIGGIVAAVAIIAIVFLVQYFSRPSLNDVRAAYAGYMDYLRVGPRTDDASNQGSSEDSWFFFTIFQEDESYYGKLSYNSDNEVDEEDSSEDSDDISNVEYISELKRKFAEFKNKFSIARLGSAGNANVRALVNEYGTDFELFTIYEDSGALENELLQEFTKNGTAGANELLNSFFATVPNNENFQKLSDLLKQYGEKEVSNIEIYNANNCIIEDTLDTFCDISTDEKLMSQNFAAQNQLLDDANALYPNLKNTFIDNTKEIDKFLGGNN